MTTSPVTQHHLRQRGRRTFAFGCGTTAAVLSVSVCAYLKWANALPPPEPLPARVLPSPNGYYARVEVDEDLAALEIDSEKWRPPWRVDLATLRGALTRRKPALDRMRSALRLPCFTPAYDPSDGEESGPPGSSAFLLFWGEARVARIDGRHADAMSASLDAIELGVKMGRGGPLIHCLAGHGSRWGVDAGERVIRSLSAAEARATGQRLDRILPELPTLAAALKEQRLVELARLREELTEPPPWSPPPADSLLPMPAASDMWAHLVHGLRPKSLHYGEMDRHFRRLVEVARLPYADRRFPISNGEMDRHFGAAMLWVTYDQPFRVEDMSFEFTQHEAYLRLFRTRLALQEYQQTHGRWPATLQEAASKLPRDAVIDPFSGGRLHYVREGDGYLLYSVGPDLKDDGGRPLSPNAPDHKALGDVVSGRLSQVREGGARR